VKCDSQNPNHRPDKACSCACECKRVVRELTGHSSAVKSVAFDPQNNDILATGSQDRSIIFWSVATSTLVYSINDAHVKTVRSLAYHNNNKSLLASGSEDNFIKIWNTSTYAYVQYVATLASHFFYVTSLAFDPSRPGIMASGSSDESIKIWDLNVDVPSTANSLTTTLNYTSASAVNAVAFETTGMMATGDDGGTIIIWETNRTTKHDIRLTFVYPVYSLAFSPLANNQVLASGHGIRGSGSIEIRLWSPSTGAQVGTLLGHVGTFPVSSLAFNPNGVLASGSWDTTVKLWNVATRTAYRTLPVQSFVNAVAFRSDGLLASGSEDKKARIWNRF